MFLFSCNISAYVGMYVHCYCRAGIIKMLMQKSGVNMLLTSSHNTCLYQIETRDSIIASLTYYVLYFY